MKGVEKLSFNLNNLKKIDKLKSDWNLNCAKPFKNKLIGKCANILITLPYQPEVFPTARESIQFEYEKPNGHYLEFEIFENDITVLEEFPDGRMFEYEIDSIKEIVEIVNKFFGIETSERNSE